MENFHIQTNLGLTNVNSLTQSKKVLKANPNTSNLISRTDLWSLDINTLHHTEEFDLRLKTNPDYYEQDEIQAMIIGISQAFSRNEKVEPISISFIDKKPTVTGGFKRYRAALLAQNQSDMPIKIAVNDIGNDAEAILRNTVRTNDIDVLSPVELGTIYFSLMSQGKSEREIADMFSVKERQVKACIATLNAPKEIRQMLINKQISDTQWKAMVANYGEGKALSLAVDVAETQAKVTPKSIKQMEGAPKHKRKIGVKELNQQLVSGFSEISHKIENSCIDENGNVLLQLGKNELEMLKQIQVLINESNK